MHGDGKFTRMQVEVQKHLNERRGHWAETKMSLYERKDETLKDHVSNYGSFAVCLCYQVQPSVLAKILSASIQRSLCFQTSATIVTTNQHDSSPIL